MGNLVVEMLGATGAQSSGRGDLPNDNRLLEGLVIAGSFDPVGMQFGTQTMPSVQVLVCDQYAAASSDDPSELLSVRATLATTQIGDMYGPVGGERVLLLRTQSGWTALLEHGPDDTPGTPAGERWIRHAVPGTDPTWNAALKFTNNGRAADDAMGGIAMVTAAAGIGDDFQNLTAEEAGIVVQHIKDFAQSIMADMMQSLMEQTSAALVTASAAASTPLQQALAYQALVTVANWIIDNVTPPTIPTGTAGTRISNNS